MMVLLAIWLPWNIWEWSYFNTVTTLGKIYVFEDEIFHKKMKCYSGRFLAIRSIVLADEWKYRQVSLNQTASCRGITLARHSVVGKSTARRLRGRLSVPSLSYPRKMIPKMLCLVLKPEAGL